MLAPRHIAAALAALLVANGGCFYTDRINERPRSKIDVDSSGPYRIGDVIMLSGSKSTDDNNPQSDLLAYWDALHCPTEGPCVRIPELDRGARSLSSPVSFRAPGKGVISVQLTVEDGQGARDIDSMDLDVVNQAPVINAQKDGVTAGVCSGGRVIGVPVIVSAEATDADDDPVTLSWEYFAPLGGGSNPDDVIFEDVGSGSYRLVPDVAGEWEVHITADDGDGGVTVHEEIIAVGPDRPPHIEITQPAVVATGVHVVLSGDGPKRLAVLKVDDALDPFPLSPAGLSVQAPTRFEWQIASPATGGQLTPLPGSGADYYLDPSAYSFGDRVTVRVEAHDRVSRVIACPDSERSCSIESNECVQRATWEVDIR